MSGLATCGGKDQQDFHFAVEHDERIFLAWLCSDERSSWRCSVHCYVALPRGWTLAAESNFLANMFFFKSCSWLAPLGGASHWQFFVCKVFFQKTKNEKKNVLHTNHWPWLGPHRGASQEWLGKSNAKAERNLASGNSEHLCTS